MKCATQQSEAIAVCAYCGRALCPDCAHESAGRRMICSAECGAALAKGDSVVPLILQKNVQQARAGAFCCYLVGALLILTGLFGRRFMEIEPLAIFYLLAGGVAMFVSGFFYAKAAKRKAAELPA